MEFEGEPDYNYLRNLFKNLMERNNYVYDLEFDWIIEAKKKQEEKKELKNGLNNLNNIEDKGFFQKIVSKIKKYLTFNSFN